MEELNKNYKISIISGVMSAALIGITYTKQPENPDYAGSIFSYNLSFFFPLLTLSFICLLICIIYLSRFIREKKRENEKITNWKWLIPSILILPASLHVLLLVFNIVRFSI